MTVSLIRSTESHTGTTGSVSQASFTWELASRATPPRGILVFTMQAVSATKQATAVTYGGVSLSKISGASAAGAHPLSTDVS